METLPCPQDSDTATSRPGSPGGWSDLSSDAEDTFFFTPEEAEDYHRDKRRRCLEQAREERLRALREEEESEVASDTWGGSDEEPDQTQKEVMRRTASHILASPNPAQLEMRILAHHGSDKRFAFLRGRWKRVWNSLKGNMEVERKINEKQETVGLDALADYEDSSCESEGEKNDKRCSQ